MKGRTVKNFGNPVAAVALVIAGLMFVNSGKAPDVAAQTSQARFDYGDGEGQSPDATTPFEPFVSQQPVGSMPPVIDGPADVDAADVTAFSDVPMSDEVKAAGPVAVAPPGGLPVAAKPPAFSGSDWAQHVFPIQTASGRGTAVAVAPDTLLTAQHIARYAAAQVGVNGQWVNGNVSHPPGADNGTRDGAIVKVPGGQFPRMKIRAPVYYEPVTVYGVITKTGQRGFISGANTVSLLPENTGIASGDEGGAVVSDDGSLVGIVSGSEPATNARVVRITRADYLLPYVPQQMSAVGSSRQVTGSAFADPTQPSAFDPPPVNFNTASCSAPAYTQPAVPSAYTPATQPTYTTYQTCRNGVCTTQYQAPRPVKQFRLFKWNSR